MTAKYLRVPTELNSHLIEHPLVIPMHIVMNLYPKPVSSYNIFKKTIKKRGVITLYSPLKGGGMGIFYFLQFYFLCWYGAVTCPLLDNIFRIQKSIVEVSLYSFLYPYANSEMGANGLDSIFSPALPLILVCMKTSNGSDADKSARSMIRVKILQLWNMERVLVWVKCKVKTDKKIPASLFRKIQKRIFSSTKLQIFFSPGKY